MENATQKWITGQYYMTVKKKFMTEKINIIQNLDV